MNAPAQESTALATVEHAGAIARREDLGLSVEYLVARVDKIKLVMQKVMQKEHHYGHIPGVAKPTLLKPGAEILCLTFQLAPEFELDERWDGDHVEIVAKCKLMNASGFSVGSGIGSCSTKESKYAYRKGERVCPKCSKPTIIKGKQEYGGGWVCFTKKGGCNAKFADNDPAIVGQQTDRIANPDLADTYNTVRKMACKRALVAAVLIVTCASQLFTQDVEEFAPAGGGGGDEPEGRPAPQQQRSQAKPPVAAAPPVQAVPSDADLERTLSEIAAIQTVDDLRQHATANRAKRWNKVQAASLKAASEKRYAELTDPDYRDDGDAEPPEGV